MFAVPITLPDLAQVVLSGVLSGGVYAVVALGLTMIFGVMRIINVAHGELLMVGAYATWGLWALNPLGLPPEVHRLFPLLTLPVVMALLFAMGWAVQKYLLNRVVKGEELTPLLITFGVSIILINSSLQAFTSDYRSVPVFQGSVFAAGLAFSQPRVISFLLAAGITVAVFVFLARSRLGKAIRATAENSDVAMVCGVNVPQVYCITFGFGAALAAAGGALVSIMYSIYPEVGATFLLKSFAIIILGGRGNYLGALVGGLILGVIESLTAYLWTARITEAVAYVILVLVLLVRPQGLLKGTPT